jgi:hypothetical protein
MRLLDNMYYPVFVHNEKQSPLKQVVLNVDKIILKLNGIVKASCISIFQI